MYRSIVRNAFGKTVFRRQLPTELGGRVVYTSAAVALSWLKPNLSNVDPLLCEITRKIVSPGDTVWDIGANVGLFSLLAAPILQASGRVLALEPDPWLCELLRRSLRRGRQSDAPIDLLPVGVSSSLDLKHLYIARQSRAANFLEGQTGSSQTGGSSQKELVIVVTLDWLLECFESPQVVKIDIEGAELDALRGAEQLLSAARPIALIEVSERNADEITRILSEAAYVLFDGDDLSRTSNKKPVERACYNTLAVPSEKLEQFFVRLGN